jgi:hypothetical protein
MRKVMQKLKINVKKRIAYKATTQHKHSDQLAVVMN